MKPKTATEFVEEAMQRGAELNAKYDAIMSDAWAPLADRARELCTLYGIDPDMFARTEADLFTMPDVGTIEENNMGIKPGTVIRAGEPLTMNMGGDPYDPLDLPLQPSVSPSDFAAQDRRVEWMLRNFGEYELAKAYKMIAASKTRNGITYRLDSVEGIMDAAKKAVKK